MIKKIFKLYVFLFVLIIGLNLFACSSMPTEPPKKIDGDIISTSPPEETEKKPPEELSAIANLSRASQKISESGIYRTETLGTVTAVGNLYKQDVKTQKKVINDECFIQSASYSSFKKTAEQQYFTQDKIYYRTGSDINKDCVVGKWGDVKEYPKAEFLEDYGCIPYGITKYYIRDEFIINSSVAKNDDATYALSFELSTDAAANMIREIKTQAGAKEYPSFISVKITVIIDSDWNIKSIITEEEYKIKMFISLQCSTHFEEKFFDVGNSDLLITEKEYFI